MRPRIAGPPVARSGACRRENGSSCPKTLPWSRGECTSRNSSSYAQALSLSGCTFALRTVLRVRRLFVVGARVRVAKRIFVCEDSFVVGVRVRAAKRTFVCEDSFVVGVRVRAAKRTFVCEDSFVVGL